MPEHNLDQTEAAFRQNLDKQFPGLPKSTPKDIAETEAARAAVMQGALDARRRAVAATIPEEDIKDNHEEVGC